MNRKLKGIMITGLTVGTLIAGGLSVYAASNTASTAAPTTQNSTQGALKRGDFQERGFDFSQLVAKGIIDQTTADKMKAFMEQFKPNIQSQMDKIKSMSEADRKAYFEENKDKIDPFAQMVSQGIITEAQADSIKSSMPVKIERDKKAFSNKFNVNDFVSKGIIDQATADKITAYINQKQLDRETIKEKFQGMTGDEKQAYFTNNKDKQRVDFLTDLVNNGILTKAQADSIKAAQNN